MEYKRTNREIHFKRNYYTDKECKIFSHSSDWGVGLTDSLFTDPSSNNFAQYFIDCQYLDIYHEGKRLCEFDMHEVLIFGEHHTAIVMFENNCFGFKNLSGDFSPFTDDYEIGVLKDDIVTFPSGLSFTVQKNLLY